MSELSWEVGLTALELATGHVGGDAADAPDGLPDVPNDLTPLDALAEALLPALEAGPCFVLFSGGRDSSAVLAVAVHAAQRHGLPPPIAITLRFPGAAAAEESHWQERVIEHLGVRDWRRLEPGTDVDYIGPIARRCFLRHGVLFPFNAHFYVPGAELADRGTLLTGHGGDDVLLWRWQREWLFLTGAARPRLRELPRLAYFAAPLPLRRLGASRIGLRRLPWLTDRGYALHRRAVAANAGEPRHFGERVAWLARRRYIALSRRTTDVLGRAAGARIEHPLLDARFLATVARAGGRSGPGSRTAAMRRFFGSVLPDDVLSRPTKAIFNDVFRGPETRAFIDRWDGSTPFPDLVDPEGFRRGFGGGAEPRLLLQATWLHSERGHG